MPGQTQPLPPLQPQTPYDKAYPVGSRVEIKPPYTKRWCAGLVVSVRPLMVKIESDPLWAGQTLNGRSYRMRQMRTEKTSKGTEKQTCTQP